MYSLYSLFFTLWVLVMLPYFAYRAWRHQKYLPALRQRVGLLPDSLRNDGRQTIWIHACSVGETLSVQPLAAALRQKFPDARFIFSTITQGGQRIAEERFASYGTGHIFYFPIDLALFARRVLDTVQPTILITIDTEIWPNVLHECHKRSIPVVMANGRLSRESFRYYQLTRSWIGLVFQNYRLMLMKSQTDAERAQRLGAMPSKLRVSGSLKYDKGRTETVIAEQQKAAIDAALGLSAAPGLLIVAGSTHEGEELLLLEALRRLRQTSGLEQTRLLIAPRHTERFTPVAALAARLGFAVSRRSTPSELPLPDVYLLDTYGELSTVYQFADAVFVGGTLIPHGGQSIMEPSQWSKATVVGPSTDNFEVRDFLERGGVLQIKATEADKGAQRDQLTEAFTQLLTDADARQNMGKVARQIFDESQGATDYTVEKIAAILEGRPYQ